MHRFNYAIAALAVIAFVSPSLAEDTQRAGPNAKTEQSVPLSGEAKRETTGGQMSGKVGGGDDRAGLNVESRKGEPGWNGARAERVVSAHRGHHRRHHYYAM
jgi:hypothetical protein